MADAADSKSADHKSCGFKSHQPHQNLQKHLLQHTDSRSAQLVAEGVFLRLPRFANNSYGAYSFDAAPGAHLLAEDV